MALLVILLLTSGCVTFCSQIVREYYLINTAKTWNDAQCYCRNSYTDLATIRNYTDMQRLENMVAASGVTEELWIGMRETGPASWLWSVGETQISEGVVDYTNWASLPNSTDNCGGMRNDGKWFSAPCTTKFPYLCQDWASDWFYLYYANKTWMDAQQDCRLTTANYDLASARSESENLVVQRMMNQLYNAPMVWIGLFRDGWKWSDQSNSSYRYWVSGQPNGDGSCSLYSPSLQGFMDRGCTYSKPFICYGEKQQFKFYVKVAMMSSFDLNNVAVSEAILKQIQSKYQHASVQWTVQPDGNIFTKKEEKTIKGTC